MKGIDGPDLYRKHRAPAARHDREGAPPDLVAALLGRAPPPCDALWYSTKEEQAEIDYAAARGH